jgi:hypothetical protein
MDLGNSYCNVIEFGKLIENNGRFYGWFGTKFIFD